MNQHGAQRMGLDILVLKQNLRNIAVGDVDGGNTSGSSGGSGNDGAEGDADVSLGRSARFDGLFLLGVVEFARQAKERSSGDGWVSVFLVNVDTIVNGGNTPTSPRMRHGPSPP